VSAFFHQASYDFRLHNPPQLLDLAVFVVLAVVTSQLASRAQDSSQLAQKREGEMRALYAFSKRLAGTHDAADIYAAIQDDVSLITRRPVVYFEAGAASPGLRHRSNAQSPTRIGQIRPLAQFAENEKHGDVGGSPSRFVGPAPARWLCDRGAPLSHDISGKWLSHAKGAYLTLASARCRAHLRDKPRPKQQSAS
jgi:hypothetical protein